MVDHGGMPTRPKRVQPSRSRRGGPGIGSCDVDLMILDAYKRKFENEPLIPTDTSFLLTTNSSLVPPSSSSATFELELNSHAYERYFDRPDVIKAYREQALIQTPEFCLLSEDASVGGRFRPRGSEEESADTSDAVYEKRHRKYETFEKRQRLREKEKLKHEQYKLKERIEQLRAMDTSAFLALPASALAPTFDPTQPSTAGSSWEDNGIANLPGAHVNGAAAYNEGERRRQEMLRIALNLEDRYRVLLPPDRRGSEKEKINRQPSSTTSIEPEPMVVEEIKFPPARDEPSNSKKRRVSMPSPARSPVVRPTRSQRAIVNVDPTTPAPFTPVSVIAADEEIMETPRRSLSVSDQDMDSPAADDFAFQLANSISASGHARASPDVATPASVPRWTSSAVKVNPPTTCLLMVAALRNTGAQARKTQRHVSAFGVKVPTELELHQEFELPFWLREEDSDGGPDEDHTADHPPMPDHPMNGVGMEFFQEEDPRDDDVNVDQPASFSHFSGGEEEEEEEEEDQLADDS
ncbi:hypothetical protein JAAARDRAFT_120493 [Jaapia argillacea MUCL 33604]|uniref:PEHE domain-containing protein n=1 Tax=Jaapia argillacea MUCL 33604 TaxID=933084 RepID=A0A067Q857_9AGAM|nr:hypothetical protein JAAARDRAFT_120493 [Jaapia argillacea MUCL 33604]